MSFLIFLKIKIDIDFFLYVWYTVIMQFDLTDDIIDELIFAMEDQQESEFLFDSVKCCVINLTENEDLDENCILDRYYSIPHWDSRDGFRVMEHFVSTLRLPVEREALKAVLCAGKGVFRNFKNALKDYPEAEQRWYVFKESTLKDSVTDWYNDLRDKWGLERIEGEPEETENLIFDDFSFRKYDETLDLDDVIDSEKTAIQSMESFFYKDFGFVVKDFYLQQTKSLKNDDLLIYICTNISGDFTGHISFFPFGNSGSNAAIVTMFFVLPPCRGLGVGKELLLFALQELKKINMRWIILPEMFIPTTFTKVLHRSGFEKTAIGFTVDLETFL